MASQDERTVRLASQLELLTEALRFVWYKQSGTSSEETEESFMEQLSFLFNEAVLFAAAKAEKIFAVVMTAHKRHKKHEYTLDTIPEGISTEQMEYRLEDEELVCPQCGETMTEIGKEVVKALKIVSAQYIVQKDIYYTYASKRCSEGTDEGCKTPIVKGSRGEERHSGSFVTPLEAIAKIITQQFAVGSPLYRQKQEINRQRICLIRQTMSNWT